MDVNPLSGGLSHFLQMYEEAARTVRHPRVCVMYHINTWYRGLSTDRTVQVLFTILVLFLVLYDPLGVSSYVVA